MRCCRGSRRTLIFSSLAALVLSVGCAQEVPEKATTIDGLVPDTKPAPPISWVDATLPAGTKIRLTLLTPLSAASSHPGDLFRARVKEGVMAGALPAIPEGSLVQGNVGVIPARGGAGGGAGLTLSFKVVNTVTGSGAALTARLSDLAGKRPVGPIASLPEGIPMTIVLEQPITLKVKE